MSKNTKKIMIILASIILLSTALISLSYKVIEVSLKLNSDNKIEIQIQDDLFRIQTEEDIRFIGFDIFTLDTLKIQIDNELKTPYAKLIYIEPFIKIKKDKSVGKITSFLDQNNIIIHCNSNQIYFINTFRDIE